MGTFSMECCDVVIERTTKLVEAHRYSEGVPLQRERQEAILQNARMARVIATHLRVDLADMAKDIKAHAAKILAAPEGTGSLPACVYLGKIAERFEARLDLARQMLSLAERFELQFHE